MLYISDAEQCDRLHGNGRIIDEWQIKSVLSANHFCCKSMLLYVSAIFAKIHKIKNGWMKIVKAVLTVDQWCRIIV